MRKGNLQKETTTGTINKVRCSYKKVFILRLVPHNGINLRSPLRVLQVCSVVPVPLGSSRGRVNRKEIREVSLDHSIN